MLRIITKTTLVFLVLSSQLQASDQELKSYYDLVTQIKQLRDQIKVSQLVASVETSLLKVLDEKITGRYTSENNTKASGFFPLGSEDAFVLIPYSVTYTNKKLHSYTKMVARNLKEISGFSQKKQDDFLKLNQNLQQYVEDHIVEITNIKVLTARALIKMLSLMDQGYAFSIKEAQNVINMALFIDFSGMQNVSVCTQVNYASYIKEQSETELSGYFGIFISGHSYNKKTNEQFAYSEKTCDPPYSVESSVGTSQRIDLSYVDRSLNTWAKTVFLKILLEQKTDIVFPDFGSPYYH